MVTNLHRSFRKFPSHFHLNKEEAVKHLLQEWKDLPKERKYPYEELAREWKIEHHGRNARPDDEKLDCFGIPVLAQNLGKYIFDPKK